MFSKQFIQALAKKEKVSAQFLLKQLNRGRAVIPYNKKHHLKIPCAVGGGLKIKVNANLGASTEEIDIADELEKIDIAVKAGTDTIMDLTVGPLLTNTLEAVMRHSSVPVGTVPIYQITQNVTQKKGSLEKITWDDIYDVLKYQAQIGVDFFTIHAGLLKKNLPIMKKQKRTGGIVSRGGAITTRWMFANGKENPFYENFDKILNLAKEYNITLSLGDGLRPGAIDDSTDDLQISELRVLGQLVKRCRGKGVQAMVEGPGHIRYDEIPGNVLLQKKICDHAPFYVLGPLPTDIAAGYDHISAAIGGALAGYFGVDFLCVVTPAEHLRHPSIEDIKDGVIASKIAAHCVNLLRFKDEWERNSKLSRFRARRDWENNFKLTLDKEKALKYRTLPHTDGAQTTCTMCGQFCSLKIMEKHDILK